MAIFNSYVKLPDGRIDGNQLTWWSMESWDVANQLGSVGSVDPSSVDSDSISKAASDMWRDVAWRGVARPWISVAVTGEVFVVFIGVEDPLCPGHINHIRTIEKNFVVLMVVVVEPMS